MSGFASNASLYDWAGMLGVFVYIGSYFALQAGLVRGQGYLYAMLNTTAAACVLLSLAESFNLSSALIQTAYICISVFGMVRFYLLTHRIAFSDEERAFLDVAAPNLDKLQSRRLLNLGTWSTALPDTELTRESQPLERLHFLLHGAADVFVADKAVAELPSHSLVGEISCLTGMPASATVKLREPARLFSIETEKLKVFLARNQSVRHELEARFAGQIGEKLVRTNAALLAKG